MIALATIIVVCGDAALTWMEKLKRKAETKNEISSNLNSNVKHIFHTSHVGSKKER